MYRCFSYIASIRDKTPIVFIVAGFREPCLSTNAFCLFLGNDALVLDEDLIFLLHLMLFIIVIVLADKRLFDLLLGDHPQIITELNLVDLVVLLFRLRSLLTVRVGLIFLPTLTR